MKALLLTADPVNPIAPHILTGLRQRIGTCESYALSGDQVNNLERFFSSFIRLGQFDRIALALPQSVIHRQSMFLRQLPHLTILAAGARYSHGEKRLLKKNLHVMPWLRVISDDHQLVQWLTGDGFDASWIYPVIDPERYHMRRRLDLPHNAYVYDPSGQISRYANQQLRSEMPEMLNKNTDLSAILLPQDVLIYWPDDAGKRPFRMMQAMALGAVVICREPGADIRLRYRWKDGVNCIIAKAPSAALEQLHILQAHPDMLKSLAAQAAEDAQRFSPAAVGEQIGAALEPPVRRAMDYPKKVRVFGFEF